MLKQQVSLASKLTKMRVKQHSEQTKTLLYSTFGFFFLYFFSLYWDFNITLYLAQTKLICELLEWNT